MRRIVWHLIVFAISISVNTLFPKQAIAQNYNLVSHNIGSSIESSTLSSTNFSGNTVLENTSNLEENQAETTSSQTSSSSSQSSGGGKYNASSWLLERIYKDHKKQQKEEKAVTTPPKKQLSFSSSPSTVLKEEEEEAHTPSISPQLKSTNAKPEESPTQKSQPSNNPRQEYITNLIENINQRSKSIKARGEVTKKLNLQDLKTSSIQHPQETTNIFEPIRICIESEVLEDLSLTWVEKFIFPKKYAYADSYTSNNSCELILHDNGHLGLFMAKSNAHQNMISVMFIGILILIVMNIRTSLLIRKQNNTLNKNIHTHFKSHPIRKWKVRHPLLILAIIFCFGVFWFSIGTAHAQNITTPQKIVYSGQLKDSQGNFLNGEYHFRFSAWSSQDYQEADMTSNEINESRPAYLGWKEIQLVTLVNGHFSLYLGDITSFPSNLFDRANVYLHIEVKQKNQPNSAFETLDVNANDATKDRLLFHSVPHAINADKIDFRDTGFDAGNIPHLNNNARLPISTIPGGTNQSTFTLDKNDDAEAGESLILKFGETLAKTLSWSNLLNRFEFNDTVAISGNLIVSGTINGQNLGTTQTTDTLIPRYPNSIFIADGTNNKGSLYEENDPNGGNVFRWSTSQNNLQDYTIQIRYVLPSNFVQFAPSNQISIDLKTEGISSQSKLDATIEKDGVSNTDQLEGNGIALSNSNWTTQNLTLKSDTNWSAGDTLIFSIKPYASNGFDAHVSTIKIRYITR